MGMHTLTMKCSSAEEVRPRCQAIAGAADQDPRATTGIPRAYPFGRSSPRRARRIVAEQGLSAAFSMSPPQAGPYGIERVGLRPDHGLGVFALKTSGRWNASWRPIVRYWGRPPHGALPPYCCVGAPATLRS